ncbi:MAG: hypothetical protein PUA77_02740, partial [Lachnospiraceae bacterium]|nr:hypothetical protein [Lachnospiraceae bacterium]
HLLKTGQVKGFFLGRSWRIPKSNIEAMILADIPKSLETAALVRKKAPADFSAEAYLSWPTRIRTWK